MRFTSSEKEIYVDGKWHARYISVLMTLIFNKYGIKRGKMIAKPVLVGFLYTEIVNEPSSCLLIYIYKISQYLIVFLLHSEIDITVQGIDIT